MNALRSFLGSLMLVACLATTISDGHAARVGEKAALQAAMQRHIDRNLVNGVFLYLDTTNGEVRDLYPSKAHSVILRMGDYFVLCSDFRDKDGKSVNVDFYLARDGDRYVVFHSAIDDRRILKGLLSEGKAERFD
ncbi:MAG: hypothetical protein R3245_09975 [Kiloniellales bacterium]|nr:hypothetical protein [Kiloniellales bacterium]